MPIIDLFQVRRDTAMHWTTTNPVLSAGEQGLETDTLRSKWGDGTTAWTGLAYANGATRPSAITYSTSIPFDKINGSTMGVVTLTTNITPAPLYVTPTPVDTGVCFVEYVGNGTNTVTFTNFAGNAAVDPTNKRHTLVCYFFLNGQAFATSTPGALDP